MAANAERLPLTREDLRHELALTREGLREELSLFREEVRTHYATKADLSNVETRLIKWMVSLMIGSVVAASGIALLIHRLLAGST